MPAMNEATLQLFLWIAGLFISGITGLVVLSINKQVQALHILMLDKLGDLRHEYVLRTECDRCRPRNAE